MEKVIEEQKRINLIKFPLPKIIYSTINGLTTFSKRSLNSSNNNTYYSRKINNKSPELPSLKMNNKFTSYSNKTNYTNVKPNDNLNNMNNTKIMNENIKISKINNIKDIKRPNLKELLNSYDLIKYYDKIIELGINDDNYNNLGLMNKKTLNEFVSNLRMFPGHIIKMEQLHQYLKQKNTYTKQLQNNIKFKNCNNPNNNENNSNCINYVTLSFKRNINNNLTNKIIHSQSHNKYRFINPAIKSKNQNLEKLKNKKQTQSKINYSNYKHLIKNKSKKKIKNMVKSNFEFPKPINPGRNILIKYFFKDLENYANNMSGIINNTNYEQNLYNNSNKIINNNIINNIKDKFNENKINNFSNNINVNHISKNNIQEINPSDLPSINNNIKINTHYSRGLISSNNEKNYLEQNSKKLNQKIKGKSKNKNLSNDKLDKSKTIHNYKIPYNINSFMKEEYVKNKNNNLINEMLQVNKKENIKNNNNLLQKTQYNISNENNDLLKIKLPNVKNKTTDFQVSLINSKIKSKDGNEDSEGENKINENKNINNIKIKNEKTILKRKNINENLKEKENLKKKQEDNNDIRSKYIDNNMVVIQSWEDNKFLEEKNTIRLREKNDNIPKKDEIINKKEINENKNDNKIDNINNKNEEIKKLNLENNNNLGKKIEIIPNQPKNKENIENSFNLEDLIYENLRLNRSFSEDKSQNIYSFDLEFICRCLSISLLILIETSKESPHITEINLEALSASHIKYFFFNENFNENINILFDLFDREVNKNINAFQISPLDKLELLSDNDESINFDVNCLKHIKKESDELLLKVEEEKEKNIDKIGRENFKMRPAIGDIEKDIKFIDEFFSMNSRKKRAINYQNVSEISKNILCKELSYINEIDSELNGTNNSNINNTNFFNNSNNNINDSIKGKKSGKEVNNSNFIDNDEMKEIKEINNNDEENNNTFSNEMNELGIITPNNDDNSNKKEKIKNKSNNSINLGGEDLESNEDNFINKKEEKKYEIEENKIVSSKINSDKIENKDNAKKLNLENIKENSEMIQVTINAIKKNDDINTKQNDNRIKDSNEKNNEKIEKESKNEEKNESNELKQEQKEDIYESDYIIDINSIDELTYYLIKRAEIFDEDFNYFIMKIAERRYIPIPDPQTIFDFMADIIILTKMEKEVIILALIYIERLIFNTGLLINSRNWRRILLTAMIIASKIWDDNSFENTHFSQVFANLGVGEINTLERIFLELINYKVYVKQSEYFKYLLMVKIIALKYSYNGKEIIPSSLKKNMKYQEFTQTIQNRMRKKVTLNNSAQF